MPWKDLLSSTDEKHDPTGSTLSSTMTKDVIDELDVKVEQNKTDITGKLDAGAQAVDSALLQGQNGAHYLSRTNHTGLDEISDVNGLQAALDLKIEGPGAAVADNILVFNGVTGRVAKDSTYKMPAGGATGQVLAKVDGADYNWGWVPPGTPDLTDATFPTYALFDEEFVVTQSATPTADFANGNKQILTANQDMAIALSAPAGKPGHTQLKVIIDGVGGHALSISTAYNKLQGTTLALDNTANAKNLLNIYWDGSEFWVQHSVWEAA